MTIKTHFALRQAGETDNASPTIAKSLPSIGVVYFPMNEGSGTTVTDLGTAGLVLDNGDAATTIAWAGPANSATITHGNAAPNAGTVPDIGATDSFVMWMAVQSNASAALLNFTLGENAGTSVVLQLSGAAIVATDGSNSATVTVSGITVGEDHFVACVFDRSTNLMSAWYGDNADLIITSTPTGTANISSIGAITTAQKITFGSGLAQHYYSCGLITFPGSIPSDYVTFLQEVKASGFSANPTIPSRWVSVT